jgi:outer membrane immunogenic protein
MKYFAYAAMVGVLASPVMAGGPVVVMEEAPVAVAVAMPTPGFDWTGFYLGASIGRGSVGDGNTKVDSDLLGVQGGYLYDMGALVVGGELAYVTGSLDSVPDADVDATRLKLIAGYGATRFMPYVFVGAADTNVEGGGTSFSDTTTLYGLGGRYAMGANGQHVVGLEWLAEDEDNFDNSGTDIKNREVSLRYDFRF